MSNNTDTSNSAISIVAPGDHDQLQECNAVTIVWQGGVMPYNMTISATNPGGLPSSQNVDGIQANELSWTVNESPGVSVDIFVTDSAQNVVMAGPFVVTAGTDCPIAPSNSSSNSSIPPPSMLLIPSSSPSVSPSPLALNSSSSRSAPSSSSSKAPISTPVISSTMSWSSTTAFISTSVSSSATVGASRTTSESIVQSTSIDTQSVSSSSLPSTTVATTSSVLSAVMTPQATSADKVTAPAARPSSHTSVIIGAVVAGFFVAALIIAAIVIRRRSRRSVVQVTSEGLGFMGALDGASSATLVIEQRDERPTHHLSSTARPISQSTFTHTTSSEMGKQDADTSVQGPQIASGPSSAENHVSLGIASAEQARFSSMSRNVYPDSLYNEETSPQSYPQYATYVREQDGGVRLAGGPLSGGSHFVEDLSDSYQVTLPPAYGDL